MDYSPPYMKAPTKVSKPTFSKSKGTSKTPVRPRTAPLLKRTAPVKPISAPAPQKTAPTLRRSTPVQSKPAHFQAKAALGQRSYFNNSSTNFDQSQVLWRSEVQHGTSKDDDVDSGAKDSKTKKIYHKSQPPMKPFQKSISKFIHSISTTKKDAYDFEKDLDTSEPVVLQSIRKLN